MQAIQSFPVIPQSNEANLKQMHSPVSRPSSIIRKIKQNIRETKEKEEHEYIKCINQQQENTFHK